MERLVTFDCFDTVLTRAVGAPRSVGYVVARTLRERGVADVPGGQFVARRAQAGALVWKRLGDAHTLRDISVQLADLLGLAHTAAEELERSELDAERHLSRTVPAAVAEVGEARASGAQVGFLSDTPVPHDVLEQMLRSQGALEDGDLLWVSNELAGGKGRGTAYPEVARRLGGAPVQWSHRGDDERADVRMARLAGVTAVLETRGRLNRYEKLLEDGAAASNGFSSLLAGASRRTRLVLEQDQPHLSPARVSVLCGVVAPMLVGYLLWCFRQAELMGCSHVVVAAERDDHVLATTRRLATSLPFSVAVHRAGDRESSLRGTPYVRVDLGRRPAVTDQASALVEDPVPPPLLVCRWRIDEEGEEGAHPVAGYLADSQRGTGVATGPEGGALVDLLSARVLGAGDTVAAEVSAVLRTFCDELSPVLSLLDLLEDVRVPTWRAQQAFWSSPTMDEARSWHLPLGKAWAAGSRLVAPRSVRAAHQAADGVRSARRVVRRIRALRGGGKPVDSTE